MPLHRFLTTVSVLLLAAPPAFAARPNIDASADRRTAPTAAAIAGAGVAGHIDERFGVPSFVWAAPSTSPGVARTPDEAGRSVLARLAPAYGLDDEDIRGLRLRAVVKAGKGGIVVAYRQEFDGVEVFGNELRVLLDPKLVPVAVSGFLPGRREAGQAATRSFRLDARAAIARALADFGVAAGTLGPPSEAAGGYRMFASDQLSQPVRTKPVLFHLPGELVPGWYIEIVRENDAEAFVVSAGDGAILFRNDVVDNDSYTYRVWADPSGIHLPVDGPQGASASPHPTGLPDFFTPPFVPPVLLTLQNGPISTNDPWLPPGAIATMGNNVDAYADLVDPDGFSPGDFRATTTSANTFDRVYDVNQAPNVSTDQQMASVTQLFYVNNFLHDWFYDVGFDEAAGNAQASNFGRGGIEGDPLVAQAQDNSGLNNANMQVFPDGASPRMQMFIYDVGPKNRAEVDSPASVAGPKQVAGGSSSPPAFQVSGDLVRTSPGTLLANGTNVFSAGNGPEWVEVADFNQDGRPDLATANLNSNDVSVLLANGSGGFAAAVSYAVGAGPYTAHAGDLNGDGRLDLVSANTGSSNFSVRLGLGDGTFGTRVDVPTGAFPTNAAIGRIDAGAQLDVVTSNYLPNTVSVFIGNGSGGFAAPTAYPTGTNPNWVEIGDLNGDGRSDLVTANYGSNDVSVLLGAISGFGGKTDFTVGDGPLTLALGDLNGDRKLDAVTANWGASTVSVLLGDGLGGFAAPIPYAVPANPVTVRLADSNSDGLLDVIVCCDASNKVVILANNGAGVLAAPLNYPVGATPYGVALADVTGDGTMDVLSANFGSNDITVLTGWDPSAAVLCPPFPNTMTGRIALIDRGSCTFAQKILAAQNAGAAGALIVNNVPGVLTMTVGGGATIPAFMVSQADGEAMKAALRTGPVRVTLEAIPSLRRDGSIDNTIVSHEWGHYLARRLAVSLPNPQGRAMSEGWGDFVALLVMVREEDALAAANSNWTGTFATASYVLHNSLVPGNSYYMGQRRYPYSTNFTKNPLTFKHISDGQPLPSGPPINANGFSNAEVHNAGEVWCAALWECYASLLRDSARLTFSQAQERMRAYLVASLAITPASPTFTEARNAVLAAAYASDMDDYRAFCAAFAVRGMGLGAVSPDRNSAPLFGVVESFTPASIIAVEPASAGELSFTLRGANPVRGATRYAFTLPERGQARVEIFDVAGRRVATLASGPYDAGTHEVRWNGANVPGVYFARFQARGTDRVVRTVVLP